MILDQLTMFSDQQAVTGTAPSTNAMDLGATGNIAYGNTAQVRNVGRGAVVPLLVQVTEDFATLTSLTVAVQTDNDPAFGTPTTLSSQTVGVAELKAGYILGIDKLPSNIKERYVRLLYTVAGANATAGKITAGVVAAVDGSYKG